MKFSRVTTILLSALILSTGVVYSFLLFGVPMILNSSYMVGKYESLISEKTGFPVVIEDFKFKTNPNLSFDLNVGSVLSQKDSTIDVINIKYLEYKNKNYIFAKKIKLIIK